VKIPTVKKRADAARGVASMLEAADGVHSASINPVTGSIIINYDPASISSEAILARLYSADCHNYPGHF